MIAQARRERVEALQLTVVSVNGRALRFYRRMGLSAYGVEPRALKHRGAYSMDDYVDADHPVRFLDAFVEGLDLEAAGFERVQAATTGRPGYHPADLLKLYL